MFRQGQLKTIMLYYMFYIANTIYKYTAWVNLELDI